jgi:hypothetical protein
VQTRLHIPHFVHFCSSFSECRKDIRLEPIALFAAAKEMPAGQNRHQKRLTKNDATIEMAASATAAVSAYSGTE